MRTKYLLPCFCGCLIFAVGCTGSKAHHPSEQNVVKQSFVHKYGMEVEKKEWNKRGESGKVVSLMKDGVICTKNYDNGYLQGDTTYTFPHSGAVQKIETFDEGRLVKLQEMFSTAKVKREVAYGNGNTRTETVWYESGAPRFREEYRDDKLIEGDYYTAHDQVESRISDGEGTRINRDDFGQLVSKDNFLYGRLQSKTLFYPNGTPREIIPYQAGKVHGEKRTFLPGGEPKTVEGWSNGVQDGITVLFQNGEKIAEVPYVNGYKNGVEQRYKDGRFVVEEINWYKDLKHGPSYSYIGDEMLISWFYNGQEVAKRQYERLTNPAAR